MTLNELIIELQKLQEEHGEREVVWDDSSGYPYNIEYVVVSDNEILLT